MVKSGVFRFVSTVVIASILGSTLTALPASAAAPEKVFVVNKTEESGLTLGDTDDPYLRVEFKDDTLDRDNHRYRQVVFDEHNGKRTFVDTCDITDGPCDIRLINTSQYISPGVHRYTAYLDKSDESWGFENGDIESLSDLENNIQTSNTYTWMKKADTFSLSTDSSFFATDWRSPTEEHYSELKLHRTNNPLTWDYLYYVFDITNDELISFEYYFNNGESRISRVPTDKNDDHITYQAFFASESNRDNVRSVSDLIDIQGVSNTVTKTRRPWSIEPLTYFFTGIDVQGFNGGGSKTTYLADKTTGDVIWSSQDGNMSYNVGRNGHAEGDVSWARGIVADPWGDTRPAKMDDLTGIIAHTDGLKDTVDAPGIRDKEQVAGGANPSEVCTQGCAGDPVNIYTGEFFDNESDLSMAGKGITPAATRHFSTQKKDELNIMGYGWRSSYEMSVESATDEPLQTSTRVKVVQENGAASFFDRQSDGTFTAQDSVQATLKFSAASGWTFVRNKRDTFVFNAVGRLESVSDIHGNFMTLSYTNNKLSKVSDSVGNVLTFHYNAEGLVSKVSTNTGRQATYTYTQKNLTSVINENGVNIDYTYDEQRRVKTLTDALGGVTENFYDSSDRVIRQNDPLDQSLEFDYLRTEGLGQTTTVTYPDGTVNEERYADGLLLERRTHINTDSPRTWRYSYDKSNNLASTVAPDGTAVSSLYDDNGNMVKSFDPDGAESTFTYDAMDNVLTITDSLGNTTRNTYDARGNLLSTTTPEGHKTTFQWNTDGTLKSTIDARGNMTGANPETYKTVLAYTGKGLLESSTTPLGHTATTGYDALERAISNTSPKGNQTAAAGDYTISSAYNDLDLPASVTDQKGRTASLTYDNAGNVLTATDAMGNTVTNTYDIMGRVKTTTTADGTSSFTYDAAGRMLTATDNLGKVTENTYDDWGNLSTVTDPMGNKSTFGYDEMNRTVKVTDPTGATSETRYDSSGRAFLSVDPLGASSYSSYDEAGQLISSIDAEGRVTTYTYNKDGTLLTVVNPDESTVSQSYDPSGNRISRVNGEGKEEKWSYDADGRMVSYVNAKNQIETYEYDADSNAVKTIRTDGSIVTSSYDATNSVTDVDYPGELADVSYAYDDLNRVIEEMINGTTTVTSYDHAGRVTNRGPPGEEVAYTYDANGNQKSITYPSGRVVSYTHNDNGQIDSMQTEGIGTASFTYDARGSLTTSVLPNGVTETRAMDARDHTTGIDISNATQQLHEITKSYSAVGNMTSSKYGLSGDTEQVGETYAHDSMNRTTDIISTLIGSSGVNAYNKAGQMTKLEGSHVSLDDVGTPLTVGAKVLSYDNLGNRIAESDNGSTAPQETLAWDTSGLLTGANMINNSTPVEIEYGYTADGLLDDRSVDGRTTEFVWDGTAANDLMLNDGDYEYIYGPNRVPLAQVELDTGTVEYLHTDVNGSVIASTASDGFLNGVTNYGAYGKRQGSAISRFGFAGEWTDPETSYIYLRARWYDPETASFLSLDPLAQSTMEPYGYAGGNPLVRIDPSGMCNVFANLGADLRNLASDCYTWMDSKQFQESATVFAAYGDGLTLGGTKLFREKVMNNHVIDSCDEGYSLGNKVGSAVGFIASLKHRGILGITTPGQKVLVSSHRVSGTGSLGTTVTGKSGTQYTVGKSGGQYGSMFGDLKGKLKANGLEIHHMPSVKYSSIYTKFTRNEGPAILMDAMDHALTRTYRGRWKRAIAVDKGDSFKTVMQRDMRDIKRLFGDKYDGAMMEMLRESKKKGMW